VCLADSLCDVTGDKLGTEDVPCLDSCAGDELWGEGHFGGGLCHFLGLDYWLGGLNHGCGGDLGLGAERGYGLSCEAGFSFSLENGGGNYHILSSINWDLLDLCLSDVSEIGRASWHILASMGRRLRTVVVTVLGIGIGSTGQSGDEGGDLEKHLVSRN